jgi:hypothetical protein
MKAGRDGRAAIWLIVATLKPQLIVLPALIPFAQRRWRVVLMAVILGLIVALTVSVSFGFHIWGEYVRLLRQVVAPTAKYTVRPLC